MINAQNSKLVSLIRPVNGTAVASATTSWVGYDYATLIVSAGASANTSGSTVVPNISLQESDGTTYTTFRATEYMNTSATGKSYMYHIPLVGRKTNFKLTLTPGTHSTSDVVAMCANLILSRAKETPTSTAGMVGNTNDSAFVLS